MAEANAQMPRLESFQRMRQPCLLSPPGRARASGSRRSVIHKPQHGAAMVEAAIALPVFLFVLINGLIMLLGAYRSLAFEALVSHSIRTSVVDGTPQRLTNLQNSVLSTARFLRLPVFQTDITVCPVQDPQCEQNNAAGANDFVRLRIDNVIPIMHAVERPMTFTVIARNEPF